MHALANSIKLYLQSEFAEEWDVIVREDVCHAYFAGDKRFELYYDGDVQTWMITGEDLGLDIISGIINIVNKFDIKERTKSICRQDRADAEIACGENGDTQGSCIVLKSKSEALAEIATGIGVPVKTVYVDDGATE